MTMYIEPPGHTYSCGYMNAWGCEYTLFVPDEPTPELPEGMEYVEKANSVPDEEANATMLAHYQDVHFVSTGALPHPVEQPADNPSDGPHQGQFVTLTEDDVKAQAAEPPSLIAEEDTQ